MTVKITQSEISFDKALSPAQGNDFEMEDISPIVRRTQVAPGLLTALFGGETMDIMLQTNTVKHDELEDTLQLPDGKAFEAYGPDIQKDKPRQMIYEVGSFGLRSNVAPKDYANRRIPGSMDLMDEAYLVERMNTKAEKAWSLFDELGFAQLITLDTNITRGGPQPIYNFYTDIIGTSRPAKIDMDLGSTTIDHFQAFTEQLQLLETDLEKTFNSMTTAIVLCGKDFFASRLEIEKQEGLARDLRGPLDLASMGVPRSNFNSGSGLFRYQWFDSFDGLRYILYSANILGTKMIADADAYLLPVGAENFLRRAYAPAQTRTYVNTSAQTRYAWSKENERNGVTMAQESNVLYLDINPQLIRALTSTT
jgi:hypothetical protein